MLIKRLYRALTHSTPQSPPHYAAVAYAAPASRSALLSVCLPGTSTVATSDYLLHGSGLAVASPKPRVFVVNIVGNPGIASFYRTFALKLWVSLSGAAESTSVLTLGHANHCAEAVSADLSNARVAASVPGRVYTPSEAARDAHADEPPPDQGRGTLETCWWACKTAINEALATSGLLTSTCRVFSLEEQVQHKVAVLSQLQALHPGCVFVLTGHSIGAWIALEVMKRSKPIRDATVKVVGLFPTVHHIGSSPNGVRLYPVFVYGRTIAATLLDAVSWAPRWLQRMIAKGALDNQRSRMTNEAVGSLLGLFDGRVAHNFLYMAKEEMEQVRSAAATSVALAEHQHKMVFYVGENDPWNAADGKEGLALRRMFPGATVHDCVEGHTHSFVLDEVSALTVASKVASWVAAPVGTAIVQGHARAATAAKAPAGVTPLSPLSEAASAAEVETTVTDEAILPPPAVSQAVDSAAVSRSSVEADCEEVHLSVGDPGNAQCQEETQPGPGVTMAAPEAHSADADSEQAAVGGASPQVMPPASNDTHVPAASSVEPPQPTETPAAPSDSKATEAANAENPELQSAVATAGSASASSSETGGGKRRRKKGRRGGR